MVSTLKFLVRCALMIDRLDCEKAPLRPPTSGYWQQSRRPLSSLVFVLPLLVVYEGGVLVLGPRAIRNGADVWLRGLLDWIGLGGYFLLPILTVAVLLAWHHTTHEPWKVRRGVLLGMLTESALLGFLLVIFAHVQGGLLAHIGIEPPAALMGEKALAILGRLVGFFGAGIYEEVLFRLLLYPAIAGLVAVAIGAGKLRAATAIVITSLAFSAAHYLGPHGDSWTAFTFLFRFLAGGFFAVLFVYRGFGIAAGTHALYDIFVGLT